MHHTRPHHRLFARCTADFGTYGIAVATTKKSYVLLEPRVEDYVQYSLVPTQQNDDETI